MKARYAIVQAPGERHDLRRRGRREAVAEVDHQYGEALLREEPAPGLVVPIESRPHHHAPPVDVVNAGQHRVRVGADVVHLDGVAIGARGELENLFLSFFPFIPFFSLLNFSYFYLSFLRSILFFSFVFSFYFQPFMSFQRTQ